MVVCVGDEEWRGRCEEGERTGIRTRVVLAVQLDSKLSTLGSEQQRLKHLITTVSCGVGSGIEYEL